MLCLRLSISRVNAVQSTVLTAPTWSELARPKMLMFELDLHFRMGSICEHQILHMNKYLIPWLWWLIVRLSPFWKHSSNGWRGTDVRFTAAACYCFECLQGVVKLLHTLSSARTVQFFVIVLKIQWADLCSSERVWLLFTCLNDTD
jgi:hypothetical protein